MTATIVVCASGTAEASATLALNLALALSAIDLRVELRDTRPEAPLARALLGDASAAPPRSPSGVRLAILAGGGLRIEARALGPRSDAAEPMFEPEVVVVEEPTADAAEAGTTTALHTADLVVVPVSTARGRVSALPGLLAAVGRDPTRVRLVLPRALARQVDRWRLVEDLATRFPGALYGITVPLGRGGGAPGASHPPTLYAPTGSAGKAYRALARLIAADLGLRPIPLHNEAEPQRTDLL